MAANIKIDDLAAEVARQLEIFQGATDEIVEAAVDNVARRTVQTLKATSPKGPSGDYARSWRQDQIKRGRHQYAQVIHASGGEYRLTHLLEKPHRIANKYGKYGTTSGEPHIAPAEEQAIAEFEAEIRRGVEALSK